MSSSVDVVAREKKEATINDDNVSLVLQVKNPHDYDRVLSNVHAKVMKNHNERIGTIEGIIVNRKQITRDDFWSIMDTESAELEMIASTLFEPKRGRTKLQSLVKFDTSDCFLYISKLCVRNDCTTNGASDLGAIALSQFLNHSSMSKVATAIYINHFDRDTVLEQLYEGLDIFAVTDDDGKLIVSETGGDFYHEYADDELMDYNFGGKKHEQGLRANANPFLRNGFFQDPYVAQKNDLILVASHVQWTQPIRTHDEAIAVELLESTTGTLNSGLAQQVPSGKDLDILQLVESFCYNSWRKRDGEVGAAHLNELRLDLMKLIRQGGSIERSHAIHCACDHANLAVVETLLHIVDDSLVLVNSRDVSHSTPLMVAAACAARMTYAAALETRIIDTLLGGGANKDLQDNECLTAYGHFQLQCSKCKRMMPRTKVIRPGQTLEQPQMVALIADRLLPTDGPTAADRAGGPVEGFVQYNDDETSRTSEGRKRQKTVA